MINFIVVNFLSNANFVILKVKIVLTILFLVCVLINIKLTSARV